jgi:hypothetical protein
MGATSGKGLRRGCCWGQLSTEGLLKICLATATPGACVGRGRGGEGGGGAGRGPAEIAGALGKAPLWRWRRGRRLKWGRGRQEEGRIKWSRGPKLNSHLW